MTKSLKDLWNEKKVALKYGRTEEAVKLNGQIMKQINKEKK